MNHKAKAAGSHTAPTTGPNQQPESKRRRALRWLGGLLAVFVVLFVLWLAICHAVFDNPRTDPPAASDAVFVLGPPDPTRMELAYQLVEQEQVADVLLIANPAPMNSEHPSIYDYYEKSEYCKPRKDIEVICFRPSPSTTQGEALKLRELAEERGWDTVTAVTFTQHISRARMILNRCYSGELRMSAVDYDFPATFVLRQYVYQTGGYLKAWLTPGCEDELPWKPKTLPSESPTPR